MEANTEISEEDVIKQLQQKVQKDLRLSYLVTGSWSSKACQEASRLLGPNYVNVVTESRKANDGKFGKIAEESTWNLGEKPAMIYMCENETVDGVEWPSFPKVLESKASDDDTLVVGDFSSTICQKSKAKGPLQQDSSTAFPSQKAIHANSSKH